MCRLCANNGNTAHGACLLHNAYIMIAPIRPPEKPKRSPAVERARRLLASKLLPPDSEQVGKRGPAAAWKRWLLAGVLIAVALWCGYLAVMAMF